LVRHAVQTLRDNALEYEKGNHRSAADTAQLRARFASALNAVGINGFADLSPLSVKMERFIKSQQVFIAFLAR
jgi:hypothetical protein